MKIKFANETIKPYIPNKPYLARNKENGSLVIVGYNYITYLNGSLAGDSDNVDYNEQFFEPRLDRCCQLSRTEPIKYRYISQ